MKKIILIDAMAIAYKAYFAFIARPLKTKSGEPTSAIFGFFNQLFRYLEEIKPDSIIVAYDSKEKTLRAEKFEQYKAHREEMPEDLVPQISRIREILDALSIPVLMIPKIEADDIVGTVARIAEEDNYLVYMVSPDKDYFQLVTEKSLLVRPGNRGEDFEVYDPEKAEERLGFPPYRMIDYLALVGDSSDNIPGVKGVGEKTAVPLIQKFATIENLYDNLEEVASNSVRTKLEENKDNAFISKELATIDRFVDLTFDPDKATIGDVDFERLRALFKELEQKTLWAKVCRYFGYTPDDPGEFAAAPKQEDETNTQKQFDPIEVDYILVTTTKEAERVAEILNGSSEFVFDTETDSLNIFRAKIAGVSFAVKERQAFFVAIEPEDLQQDMFAPPPSERLPLAEFKRIFTPVFANTGIKKICQNGKYDIAILRSAGIEVKGFYFDTMVASYLIDPDQKHGMDDLAEKWLGYKTIPISSIIGEKKDPSHIFDVELSALTNYACEDSDITFRLYNKLKKKIAEENLEELAFKVEFPLVEVLEDIERNGVKIDSMMLKQLSEDLDLMMMETAREIYKVAGEEFNINSPQQMQRILFDKLNLTTGKKTKTGFSTNAQTLESLRGEHEIIELILTFRQLSKLKSTYADALPTLIEPATGKVHTSFNQTVVSTGRLSSNDPNLQNIPIRTELGKEIRKAFVGSTSENVILSLDYSQIELRIMASICGDEFLTRAFLNGEDIHRSTAALVFMVDPGEVTPDMRRKAKEVNFGILYGIGAFGLKNRLGITQNHAKEIIETYFNTFKRVKEFVDGSIENARTKGYAETLMGRRRYLPNINSKNFAVKQFEERVAINMPIQGTAADMIKIAMINVHRALHSGNYKTKMILQVHDELLFDTPKNELEVVTPLIKNLMETALPLNVPVVVDSGYGPNWLEAH
ncbi:MAG: DNA polymerase I [Ignavibacteriales bacterium]|nr:MAG: DNA polymerase I [Ignavibacteriaceae bacterium]MBW7872222.1 DNA polymerase I [Ignavibacteria bacterium]MCZ2144035.1 DNA polymerase I [Ignavibacteriales bacterium]OQY70464.1 MAG: DNA polymerase I [Ignavibacteriales bacterium UTCHB3]MBV6445632.1 DNA polymerase I [Ignavibacteriaceae bacterium]